MIDDSVDWASAVPGLDEAPLWTRPSRWQHAAVGKLVHYEDGADPEGNWLGVCPLAPTKEGSTSAVFNFDKGVMRCEHEPCCHQGRRATSIMNLLTRMAQGRE